jgi:hypothetical protein
MFLERSFYIHMVAASGGGLTRGLLSPLLIMACSSQYSFPSFVSVFSRVIM